MQVGQLAAVGDRLPAGILLTDGRGRVLYANEPFCTLLGIPGPAAALAGGTCRRLLARARALARPAAAARRVAAIMAAGQPLAGERVPLAGGRWLAADYFPCHLEGGEGGHLWHLHPGRQARRGAAARPAARAPFPALFAHAPAATAVVDLAGRLRRVNGALCTLLGYSRAELLGASALGLVHPPDLPALLDQVLPVLAGTAAACQQPLRLRHRDGPLVAALAAAALVRDPAGQPLYFVAQCQDARALLRPAEELHAALAQVRAQQTDLALLSERLLLEREVLVQLTAAATAMAGGDLDRRVRPGAGGELDELARALNRLAGQLQGLTREREASRRRIIAAQEAVRRQVAEQLHGSVQSKLLVLWYQLGQCQEQVTREPQQALRTLAEVRARLEELQEQEVRALSHRLHPAILKLGLPAALQYLQDQFSGPLAVSLDLDPRLAADPYRPGAAAVLAAYRVVEEALGNILRHAHAARAGIRAAVAEPGLLVVTVEDDGIGFPAGGAQGGLGLQSARDYVAALGGTLTVESAPGRGTRVTARVPLAADWGPDGAAPAGA